MSSFDFVVAAHVLEHMRDVLGALQSWLRVCRRGGWVLFMLPDPCDLSWETGERARYWFRPNEVWECRGADFTVSPVHMAAVGLVHPQRGLSMRFPRFIRKRPDKRLADATTPAMLAELYKKQAQGQGGV